MAARLMFALLSIDLVGALNASQIARANTPRNGDVCGGPSIEFPPLVLGSCTEAIPAGIVDMRGVYKATMGSGLLSLTLTERIEQCGLRFTVSGPVPNGHWFIHDFPAADGTMTNGVQDYNAAQFPSCSNICAYGKINATCMEMWYDKACTDGTEGTGFELGARRCKKPDGTIEFYNEMIADQTGGPLVYQATTIADAEAAMVQSNQTFGRLQLVRVVLPILITLIVLSCISCCVCVYCCKRRKTCCFAPSGA